MSCAIKKTVGMGRGENDGIFISERQSLVLTDTDELLSLKKVVGLRAMALHEDVLCLKEGKKNSVGKEISKTDIDLDVKVLNALSGALRAINT